VLNGLVSSISGIIVTNDSNSNSAVGEEGLVKLTMLNTVCEVDDVFWSKVKEFRIVMLLKTVLNWPSAVEGSQVSRVVSTEILRLLRSLFPWIKHINGDFWEKAVHVLKDALQVTTVRVFF
jgi:hypothetical protein